MSTLKIGLNTQPKKFGTSKKPTSSKTRPVFGDEDSDGDGAKTSKDVSKNITTFDHDNNDSRLPTKALKSEKSSNSAVNIQPSKPKLGVESGVDLSTLRAQKKKAEEAEALDPSIYDYDAAYDAIHAKSAAKKAAERADAEQRKPKYMSNLLEAAEIRKRDQLRAQDKLLQREREAEGDEFADKEKFVTGAYKEQQEEVRRLAEKERQKEEQEEARRKTHGMRGFYRNVMNEEDRKHQDAVRALTDGNKATSVHVEDQPQEKSATELAQEMNAKGASVVINEEGQVADKRQLLTAGLNLVAKPKASGLPASNTPSSSSKHVEYQGSQSRGAAQKAMRERQTRMMEAQLEQAAKRAAEVEDEERQKMERAAKSRKTEGEVSSARERYLQRKREAAAAAAAER